MPYELQTPNERLDYSFDWSTFLAEGGSPQDVISSVSWALTPMLPGSPTTPLLDGGTTVGDVTTIWVSLLQAGVTYQLKAIAVTSLGREPEQSITIRCGAR
jgi:hypothetical protein